MDTDMRSEVLLKEALASGQIHSLYFLQLGSSSHSFLMLLEESVLAEGDRS